MLDDRLHLTTIAQLATPIVTRMLSINPQICHCSNFLGFIFSLVCDILLTLWASSSQAFLSTMWVFDFHSFWLYLPRLFDLQSGLSFPQCALLVPACFDFTYPGYQRPLVWGTKEATRRWTTRKHASHSQVNISFRRIDTFAFQWALLLPAFLVKIFFVKVLNYMVIYLYIEVNKKVK